MRTDQTMRSTRILVIGGGFAGTYTALELRRRLGKSNVDIAVVNRQNFFVFYPLLPEILSGEIETEHILTPIRQLVPGISLYVGDVEAIDLDEHQVKIRHGLFHQEQVERTLGYDILVLALGGVPNSHGIPGLEEHAFDVNHLARAFGLRNHLIDLLEQADIETNPVDRNRLLTVVVAGGGTTGVEVAAEIRDLMTRARKYYRTLSEDEMRVVLVHGGERLIPQLPASLARYTERLLRKRGVEIRLKTYVSRVGPERVTLSDGTVIETKTVVSSVGIQPNPLTRDLPLPHDRHGQIEVDEYLRVSSRPEVWAVGDNALVIDPHTGKPYPQTAQHAIREARLVARNIAARMAGEPLHAMRYRTRGQMVALGHRSAAIELNLPGRTFNFAGPVAWFLWRTYYLAQLPRWTTRLRITIDWTMDLLFPPQLVQLKVGTPSTGSDQPAGAVNTDGDLAGVAAGTAGHANEIK